MGENFIQIANVNHLIGNGLFPENHFFSSSPSTSSNPLPIVHDFDRRLIYLAEFYFILFKEKFGVKSKIKKGDTFRTKADKNYSSTSQHSFGRAIDLNWADPVTEKFILRVLSHDFRTKGPIFRALFNLGIRGFGLYNTFSHADTRIDRVSENYNGEMFEMWDNRNMGESWDRWAHEEFFLEYPKALHLCEIVENAGDPISAISNLENESIVLIGSINTNVISNGNTGINGGAVITNDTYNEPINEPAAETISKKATNGASIIKDELNYILGGFKMLFSKRDEEDGLKRYDFKQMFISFAVLFLLIFGMYFLFKTTKRDA